MTDISSNTQPKVSYLVVSDENSGQRIDNFLTSRLKGLPKSRLYRLLRKGEVRVNKKRVKPDFKLSEGDEIRLPPVRTRVVEQRDAPDSLLSALESSIIFESDEWIVVNKPPGLAVHGGSGLNFGLIEAMRQVRPDSRSLELCHRLDKATSGCLVLAKKRAALKRFHQCLREKRLEKKYLALVSGRWPAAIDAINVPLEKNVLSSGERMVRASTEGRPSQTMYKILDKFDGYTLVEAMPVTGRTHQIRVHCKEAGHPIVGDEKYGSEAVDKSFRQAGYRQLFLHARSITLPQENHLQTITCQPSDTWKQCIDNFLQPAR